MNEFGDSFLLIFVGGINRMRAKGIDGGGGGDDDDDDDDDADGDFIDTEGLPFMSGVAM